MLFILVLIIAATAVAGSAAFFSIYGLAATFSGAFWSVVVMGGSLEVAKLVAASYLYRYWDKTNIFLKSYLMAGVAALMLLTSTGIFGYLSASYQQDALPLKQIEQQVTVLDAERARQIQRKAQIDDQIAQLPTNSVKGRTQLMKGFKDEQATVTKRIADLDAETLSLKQKQIQAEAHTGPITFIASTFGWDTDNAAKYLIYIIIFAFDPMAVALTLAVNIAQRLRKEEMLAEPEPEPEPERQEDPIVPPEDNTEMTLIPDTIEVPKPPVPDLPPPTRAARPYEGTDGEVDLDKVSELVNHFRHLQHRRDSGQDLSPDDQWNMQAIENYMKRHNLQMYL